MTRVHKIVLALVLTFGTLAALFSNPAPASASGGYDLTLEPEGLFLMPGLTAAVSNQSDGSGAVVGGELSVVYSDFAWYGFYVDGVYDTHNKAARISFGPEVGVAFVGFDGGPIIEVGDKTRFGLQGRAVVSLGYVAPYFRAGAVSRDNHNRAFFESGVLLKVPITLDGENPFGF